MEYYSQYQRLESGSIAALGYFDGVHRGHRRVIDAAVQRAHSEGLPCAVFTFCFDGDRLSGKGELDILTREQKQAQLAQCGVDVCVELPFSQLKDVAPEAFVSKYISGMLGARCAVCGADYTFGRFATGAAADLTHMCSRRGIDTLVVDKLVDGECEISSGRIKKLLTAGDVSAAAELLGYRYYLDGGVCSGAARGRKLGWPTLNQRWPQVTPLKNGVYVTRALAGGEWRGSVTNVGVRPTFYASGERVCETHLLGYTGGDIRLERVEFVAFLREERRFSCEDELIAAISADARDANKVLQSI